MPGEPGRFARRLKRASPGWLCFESALSVFRGDQDGMSYEQKA